VEPHPFTKIDLIVARTDFDSDVGVLADYMVKLHNEYSVPYKEMVIVGPSLEKNNMTSQLAGKINTILSDRNVPCYNTITGSFVPNGVLFTTIQGVKGKEFDYVFIYGVDSYPETFKMIPYEEAESLIYVMHTRARKRICYVSPKRPIFVPPRGVRGSDLGVACSDSHPFLNNPEVLSDEIHVPEETKPHYYRVTDLITDHSFMKLLNTNGFSVEIKEIGFLETELPSRDMFVIDRRPPQSPAEGSEIELVEIEPRLWGVLNGFAIACYLRNSFPSNMRSLVATSYQMVSDREYLNLQRRGTLLNGFDSNTGTLILKESMVNGLRQEEREQLQQLINLSPQELTTEEMLFMASVYDFLNSGNMISRYSNLFDQEVRDLVPAWVESTRMIEELFGKVQFTEKMVELGLPNCLWPDDGMSYNRPAAVRSILGSIDAEFNDYVVEFKTMPFDFEFQDGLQVMMYSLQNGKAPVLFNLETGAISQVTSKQSLYSWRHLLKSYCQLRTHVEAVVDTQNRRRKDVEQNRPSLSHFVLDTEFIPGGGDGKGKGTGKVNDKEKRNGPILFDIALVNMQDPYRSLISLLRLDRNDLVNTAAMQIHVTPDALRTAKTLPVFIELFKRCCLEMNITRPVLGYYVAATDVSWVPLELKGVVQSVDLGAGARNDSLTRGYISSGQPPPLSDYYGLRCQPVITQPHLELHTALPDTLMLYELVALGIIKMEG
jgi:hypothetical protein